MAKMTRRHILRGATAATATAALSGCAMGAQSRDDDPSFKIKNGKLDRQIFTYP